MKSILGQTLNDFNVIVLDNASTDGTAEWIESLNDSRIVLYRSPQSLTIEANWGRIKDVAKNEFITLIGHDDLLHAHYLQEMDDLIARHPSAALYQTCFNFIDAQGGLIRNCLPMDEVQYSHEFLASQMARTIDSTGTGYMMRSADYDKLGGMPVSYPNLIFADYALWLGLMRKGYKATAVRSSFSYRIHPSVSYVSNGMVYQEAFAKYVTLVNTLIKEDPATRYTVQRYGKDMLLYWCESLSHRLLKTPIRKRSLKVKDFIRICEGYAREWIPDQDFQPTKKLRIRAAVWLDGSFLTRELFRLFRRLL
jgi:glycosyltransferase involved in cell wall biosynthesis